MQVGGAVTAPLDAAAVFALVADPERLATCIPGLEGLKPEAEDRYSATVGVQLGFLSLKFAVEVTIAERQPPERLVAQIQGKPLGSVGQLKANALLVLQPAAGGGTRVQYTLDLNLTGRLGGVGQPVFRAQAEAMAKRFGQNLEALLAQSAGEKGARS